MAPSCKYPAPHLSLFLLVVLLASRRHKYSHENIFKTVFYLYPTLQNQTNQINPKHLPHSLKSCSHCALLPLRTYFSSETQSESVCAKASSASQPVVNCKIKQLELSPVLHITVLRQCFQALLPYPHSPSPCCPVGPVGLLIWDSRLALQCTQQHALASVLTLP